MRSIERNFNNISKKNPNNSSLINFIRAISGQNFSDDRLMRNFKKLVDKKDYDKKDKNEVFNEVRRMNNSA